VGLASAALALSLSTRYAMASHDEGLYLATARSLATTGEYRLINLPSAPHQTKYPPGYPLVLAGVERILGVDPGDIRSLKTVNAVFLALIVILAAELASRLVGGSPAARIVAAVLAGTSLGLVTHVDVIGSDLMFIALVLASMMTEPDAAEGASWRSVSAGLLFAAATLTRSVGIAAALGAAIVAAPRQRGRAVSLLAPTIVAMLAWAAWCAMVRPDDAGPLVRYYIVYEHFVWLDLLTRPAFVIHVAASNAAGYFAQAGWALGAPTTFVALIIAIGAGTGALTATRRSTIVEIAAMSALYAVVLLGYPAIFARYLLPAVPLVCALTASAAMPAVESRPRFDLARVLGLAAVATLVLTNAFELHHYSKRPSNSIHVGFDRYLPSDKQGFLDTAEWIRSATPPDAVLGSANDTMYYVLTSRRAIRPWPHEPEAYNPDYYQPARPADADVPGELRKLGVSYLVVDPFLSDLEGAHAANYMSRILGAPHDTWRLVFTSSDSLHRIYRREEGTVVAR
jgi:4-amino-4-deoxy-L-arabinose transferase-like glycosyltransferase